MMIGYNCLSYAYRNVCHNVFFASVYWYPPCRPQRWSREKGMHLAPDISIGTLANAVRPDDIEPKEVTELTWGLCDITPTIVSYSSWYIYIWIYILTFEKKHTRTHTHIYIYRHIYTCMYRHGSLIHDHNQLLLFDIDVISFNHQCQ